MNLTTPDLTWILINIVVLLLSLSVHEAAHAWTADRLGDATARSLGRVTLNPLSHVDPIGTLLFPLLGLLSGGFLFGWAKPVPVQTANLTRPRADHTLIAAAGPASNLLAAFGFLLLSWGLAGWLPESNSPSNVLFPLRLLARAGVVLNVILAVFNLLPIPPLDGSWILNGVLPDRLSVLWRGLSPYGFLILLLLLYTGWLSRILGPAVSFARQLTL